MPHHRKVMRAAQVVCRLVLLHYLASMSAFGAPDSKDTSEIATSINALGLDLYREQIKTAGRANVLLSPYSISSALAMTYMGADGETSREMSRVLRFPADPVACGEAYQLLTEDILQTSTSGGDVPLVSVANRLFVRNDFSLLPRFAEQTRGYFRSEIAMLDFRSEPEDARLTINRWVADQTNDKILDLIPPGSINEDTHLALVNAIYLRTSWEESFDQASTKPERFNFNRAESSKVTTMNATREFGYSKRRGFTVVTIPYSGRTLQCVLIVPDSIDGLAKIERSISGKVLAGFATLKEREVILHLPRFELEPGPIMLKKALMSLGLHRAFDDPRFSADFSQIAPPTPEGYLALSSVVHKAWLSLDESGTEAAAATGEVIVLSPFGSSPPKPPPVEVRVDRPFMFAIQHVESGACLFLGRMTDPR